MTPNQKARRVRALVSRQTAIENELKILRPSLLADIERSGPFDVVIKGVVHVAGIGEQKNFPVVTHMHAAVAAGFGYLQDRRFAEVKVLTAKEKAKRKIAALLAG